MSQMTRLGAAGVALLTGCLVDNMDYVGPPDLSTPPDPPDLAPLPPDMKPCPTYPTGGGAGRDRPEVLVPGGMYQIGDVKFPVKAFYLDVFEVSVGAFRQCRSVSGCKTDPGTSADCNWTAAAGAKEDHPINCVTWMQADEFCKWAGRRLPTEGEWEYAAAGMGRSTYPWGEATPDNQLCWKRASGMGTCPVGGFDKTLLGAKNCGGAADLAGNVWEWTATEYKTAFVYPEPMCSMTSSSCSLRGGSWVNYDADVVRAGYRDLDAPSRTGGSYGFRCARTAL